MNVGAIITRGPKDWQIIQQKEGKADVYLSGHYVTVGDSEECQVYVRVVLEDTSESIIKWTPAQHLGGNNWEVTLREVPVGGLYRIESCLRNEMWQPIEWSTRGDMIHHIGVGDVYVIAGQSNSAGYGKGPIFDPPEIGIHLLKNSGKWDLASHPFNESTHTIHTANREGGNPGHSPYLSFAKRLKHALGYPIGLIQTSLGGSPLSAWNPEEDGVLYKNMMQIIKDSGADVKGILWYQGCSDTNEIHMTGTALTYLDRFKTMVSAMRKDLENQNLPLLTVQLNRVVNNPGDNEEAIYIANEGWSLVREAQRKAAREIPHVYITPAIDSTLSDAIHNSSASNLVIGERMARSALGNIYGKKACCNAPDLEHIEKIDSKEIRLIFNNVYERLFVFDAAIEDTILEVIDENGQVKVSGYDIHQNVITLYLARELQGSGYVNCGYGRNPKGHVPMDIEGQQPVILFYKAMIE